MIQTDDDLIARRVITLEVGQSIHLDQKLVLVAIDDKAAKLMPLRPHEHEAKALPSYRAGLLRAKRHARNRLTKTNNAAHNIDSEKN